MSNAYDKSLILSDPSATVAGKNVNYETPDRVANSINYNFAVGGTHNVLSQAYTDNTFIQNSNSYQEMSEWRIPLVSLDHNELEIVLFYDIYGTSSLCKAKFTLTVGAVSAVLVLNLPSTSSIQNNKFSISFPGNDQYYATLKMEIIADSSSSAEVIIKSIMARWTPIASPISAGFKNQYSMTEFYTPFGTGRTAANNSFTSRFAHNAIDNITILRKRMKSLLTWSGVYNADSTVYSNPLDGSAPVIYLSVGHIKTMLGYALAPAGYDRLTHKKLELHVKSIGASTNTEFDFFGNRITLTNSAGVVDWSIHELEINYDAFCNRGNRNLPIYEAGLDSSNKNADFLANYGNIPTAKFPTINSTNHGTIIALTLFGL